MIVKNEEDWIAGALDSVRSVVDEVILADTGSTDSTLERARPFSPKVLNYQWNDNFAEARNCSLAEARHPWILVLDADERIAARDLPALLAVTHGSASGTHLIQRNYVFGNQVFGWTANNGEYPEGEAYPGYVDNPLIRFFRNDPAIRFHGAVHEIIDPLRLPKGLHFDSTTVVLHHYGKVRGEQRVAAKQLLYLELGLKKVREDGANPKAFLDLGIQYQELNRHRDAVSCFDQAFQLGTQPVALLYRAISEKHLANYTVAHTLLLRALELGLNTFDVHLEMGNVLLALNRNDEALNEYALALRARPANPIAEFNRGLALQKKGDTKAAERQYKRALELDPTFKRAALELSILQGVAGRYDEALQLLRTVIERNPDYREARLALAKTCIQSNRPAEALQALVSCAEDDALSRSLIGAAHLQQGNITDAQTHLESALRRDRSLVDARINLAQVYTIKGDFAKAERFRISARQAQ